MKKMLCIINVILALSGCATGQETVSAYRWMGDPLKMPPGDNPASLAAAQCRWEMRQATLSRSRAPYYSTGGYNNAQVGAAVDNLGAAMASTIGPGVLDECMAAKGWQLEYRQ